MPTIKVSVNYSSEESWPKVNLDIVDFRSVFGGDLLNFSTLVESGVTNSEYVRSLASGYVKEICLWIMNSDYFSEKANKFQIIIGWDKSIRKSSRRIVKCGGTGEDIEKIASGEIPVRFVDGWELK